MKLSPVDWMAPEVHILFAYFYDRRKWQDGGGPANEKQSQKSDAEKDDTSLTGAGEQNDPFMSTSRMISSLTRLIIDYPILGGRFVKNPVSNRFSVSGFDAEIPFVEAKSSLRLEELPLSVEKYTRTDVLPASLQLGPQPEQFPDSIFAVQHTRFACGSVCVGMMMHHRLADASGYWQLWKDWAHMYQTNAERLDLSRRPSGAGDRSFMIPPESVMQERAAEHEEKAYWVPPPSVGPPHAIGTIQPLITRILRFSSGELGRMKAHATATLPQPALEQQAQGDGTKHGEKRWISTFDAMTAHLMRHIFRAQLTPSSLQSALTTSTPALLLPSINWRDRITSKDGPPAPPRFFGNAILKVSVAYTSRELLTESLGSTAYTLHTTIASTTEEQILGSLAWIGTREDPTRIVMKCDRTRDVRVTSWNKFGLYSVDFERGLYPTRAVRYGRMEGIVVLSVNPDEGDPEALDVMVSLTEEQHRRLDEDQEFRGFRH
jgi:hypothetical protein